MLLQGKAPVQQGNHGGLPRMRQVMNIMNLGRWMMRDTICCQKNLWSREQRFEFAALARKYQPITMQLFDHFLLITWYMFHEYSVQ